MLRCNVVYGYSEQVTAYDDLYLLMAHGTAARCDFPNLFPVMCRMARWTSRAIPRMLQMMTVPSIPALNVVNSRRQRTQGEATKLHI